MSKLQSENRTVIIGAINSEDKMHLKFLNDVFLVNAKKWRMSGIIFVNLDFEEDKTLLNYFKISEKINPKIIAYNFMNKRFYVDQQDYITENNQKENLNLLLDQISNRSLIWTSGNYFEDILIKLGFEINNTTLLIAFCVIVGILMLVVILAINCCDTEEISVPLKTSNNNQKQLDKNNDKHKNNDDTGKKNN